MKVLFWNVWCLPQWFTDGKYTSDQRAKLISRYLGGYDLVLLCEAWTTSAKSVFLKETLSDYPYRYTDNSAGLVSFGTGLMVLSKYPLKYTSQEIYNKAADFDWFSNKGVFGIQIDYPSPKGNKLLTFFFTHMQATYNNSWPIFNYSSASQTARLYQTVQLSKFVNKTLEENKTTDVWLLGDFNMWRAYKVPIQPSEPYDDNMMRIGCYDLLTKEINMKDIEQNDSTVYRLFTRSSYPTKITYEDSHGLSDGSYVVIDIDMS